MNTTHDQIIIETNPFLSLTITLGSSREAICLVSEYLRSKDHAQVFEAANF